MTGGLGLVAANWFILSATLVVVAVLRFAIIPMEERELVERFGSDYRKYIERTGSMLPKLRGE